MCQAHFRLSLSETFPSDGNFHGLGSARWTLAPSFLLLTSRFLLHSVSITLLVRGSSSSLPSEMAFFHFPQKSLLQIFLVSSKRCLPLSLLSQDLVFCKTPNLALPEISLCSSTLQSMTCSKPDNLWSWNEHYYWRQEAEKNLIYKIPDFMALGK